MVKRIMLDESTWNAGYSSNYSVAEDRSLIGMSNWEVTKDWRYVKPKDHSSPLISVEEVWEDGKRIWASWSDDTTSASGMY